MDSFKILDESYLTELRENHQKLTELSADFEDLILAINDFAIKYSFLLDIDFENYEIGGIVTTRSSVTRNNSKFKNKNKNHSTENSILKNMKENQSRKVARRDSFWMPTEAALRRRESVILGEISLNLFFIQAKRLDLAIFTISHTK